MNPFRGKFRQRSAGVMAEQRAASFLKHQRHRILDRNFYCRFGEIDLITRDPTGCLVFVEVRFRTSSTFATAAESVTHNKQDKMRKSAQIFLGKHPGLGRFPARFDVITLQRNSNSGKITIDWIQNAFY